MTVFHLFNELDVIIAIHFSVLEDALKTDRGQELFRQLISEENRAQLREWYKCRTELNSLAMEIKQKLETELGHVL